MANQEQESREELKRALELARLDLEKARHDNERHRTFLEHYQTELDPLYTHTVESVRAAVGFSQAGIKSLFILNGGALIALPAFHALLNKIHGYEPRTLLYAAGLFVLGLILSGATNMLAYLAQSATTRAVAHSMAWHAITVNEEYKPSENKQQIGKEIADEKSDEKKWGRRFKCLAWSGVACATAALATFVAGAATVLSGHGVIAAAVLPGAQEVG